MRLATDEKSACPVALTGIELAQPDRYRLTSQQPAWAAMRQDAPIWAHQLGDTTMWSVTRYEDVRRVIGDHRHFGSRRGTILAVAQHGDPAGGTAINLTDPPHHGDLRRPTMQLMSTRVVRARNASIRENVRGLLRNLIADGGGDFAAVIRPLAMTAIGEIIGVPRDVWYQVADAAMAGVAPSDPHYRQQDVPRTLHAAHHTLFTVLTDCMDRAARTGEDTVIGRLGRIDVRGRRLGRQEALINAYSFVMGANTTTPHVANQLVLQLARMPELANRLREDPAVLRSVVEESLRWSTPTNHLVRQVRRPVRLAGREFSSGEYVCAWVASADHDERIFREPWQFRPDRAGLGRHLAFGRGAHYCIGAPPAREVLTVLLEELLRLPPISLVGEEEHLESNFINGITSLPITIRS